MKYGQRSSFSASQVRYIGVLVLVVLDAIFGGIRRRYKTCLTLSYSRQVLPWVV